MVQITHPTIIIRKKHFVNSRKVSGCIVIFVFKQFQKWMEICAPNTGSFFIVGVDFTSNHMTCSSPRRAVRSHSLVCSENSLLIVRIGPVLNKVIEIIFRSDCSDRTCIYSLVSLLSVKFNR